MYDVPWLVENLLLCSSATGFVIYTCLCVAITAPVPAIHINVERIVTYLHVCVPITPPFGAGTVTALVLAQSSVIMLLCSSKRLLRRRATLSTC